MTTYREPDYDDTVCATCEAPLPEQVTPGTWPDHGFCSLACALRCAGGYHLTGKQAEVMAEYPGRLGGPGFERDLVLDWLKGATANAPAMLSRISGEADLGERHASSWSWRLYSGGVCRFQRLTAKEFSK